MCGSVECGNMGQPRQGEMIWQMPAISTQKARDYSVETTGGLIDNGEGVRSLSKECALRSDKS